MGRRQKQKLSPPLPLDSPSIPLLLAAAANLQNPRSRSIIKRSLRSHLRILTARSTTPPHLHHHQLRGLLSLLPLLLTTRYSPSVSALSAEVVGAAALHSLEANAMIASDEAIIKGLLRALGIQRPQTSESVCNAIMDLSTSSIGRDRLRESSAVQKLLSLLCQMGTITSNSLPLQSTGRSHKNFLRRGHLRNNLLALVLDAVVTLINSSSEDCLKRIPEELIKSSLPVLRKFWGKLKCSSLMENCSREQSLFRNTKYDIAATIFRLSMDRVHYATWGLNEIWRSIFGCRESVFENFILKYWEESPLVFRRSPEYSESDSTLFSSLIHSFNLKSADSIVNSILDGYVSCPPIASDEIDIFSFLDEVNGVLGSPIMYGQDIRILKTQKQSSGSMQENASKEVHFFEGKTDPKFIAADCVQKCKEAVQAGYTVALRGIEFRSEKVAAIAEGFADLFGQPSVGANIYLTPPGSQGLARHYDDHCVFVWQLFGRKKWKILPHSTTVLPRLYEPLGSVPGLDSDGCEGIQFLLQEGDVLYIPRGFPHEAHTIFDESESQNELATTFSLHLTLGVEVEPPFEWEGFAHVALHCWNEKQKQLSRELFYHKSGKQRAVLINLLHVAIRLVADLNPIFRKACMAAALPLSRNTEENHHVDAIVLNQRATFADIIDRIGAGSCFMEALKEIETVQERSEGWMRWLHHLPYETEKIELNNILGEFKDSDGVYIKEVMIEFDKVKSDFCKHAVFEEACEGLKMLVEKYRKTRKQYTRGMLSLHSMC